MTEYVKWPNTLYPTAIVSWERVELSKTCAILDPTIWKTFVCSTKPCSSVKGLIQKVRQIVIFSIK